MNARLAPPLSPGSGPVLLLGSIQGEPRKELTEILYITSVCEVKDDWLIVRAELDLDLCGAPAIEQESLDHFPTIEITGGTASAMGRASITAMGGKSSTLAEIVGQ